MNNTEVKQARFSDKFKYIIDSDGNRVELDDPRVTHIWAIDNSLYTLHCSERIFQKYGRRFRIGRNTDTEIIQYAKKLSSGRECLPCVAITGSTLMDVLNNREKDEISIYHNLDQDGPCQNGAWPVIWDTFAKRLNLKNIIFSKQPDITNNFLGLEKGIIIRVGIAVVVGDLLDEAENALKCLARDKESALKIFEEETNHLYDSFGKSIKAIKLAVNDWSENVAKIPLKATVKETPKVLVFGGLNVLFVHYPLKDYFIEQGVIPKIVDFSEGATFIASESIIRFGLKRGLLNPEKQFKIGPMLFYALFSRKFRKEARLTLQYRLGVASTDFFKKRYRKIMEKSGLIYDLDIPFPKIVIEGSKYVSYNGFNETSVTTGRYICSVKDGLYDGLVNLGAFNCQPAMNSQAIIRPVANNSDVPYVSIDCEGPWISANQRRLLETVAVQARRIRENKNEKLNQSDNK